MVRVVVGGKLAEQLRQARDLVELVDEDGRVLGRLQPPVNGAEVEYELTEPPISEEELQRREKSERWYSTQEVLERLRKLENR